MKDFFYTIDLNSSKADDIKVVREYYVDFQKPVTIHFEIDDDRGYECFNAMPKHTLPVLPAGYRWVKHDNKYGIMRTTTTPEKDIHVVIYGPNKNQIPRINYIMQVDDVTTYGFAHTKNSDGPKDRNYPMNDDAFRVPTYDYSHTRYKTHIRGHVIDHQDTITNFAQENWSTLDARNYIPEPPIYNWGLCIRRLAVQQLRKRPGGGAYAQQAYYSDNPATTMNGTKVPKFVYFYPYSMDGDTYTSANPYNIKWDEDLPYEARGASTVLEYAKAHFTTSIAAAPVVVPYEPIFSDRALRYQARQAVNKLLQIQQEEVQSRFPDIDKGQCRCVAADTEFEGSTRKMLAGIRAHDDDDTQKMLSSQYVCSAVNYGEGLVKLDQGLIIFSPLAQRSTKQFLRKNPEYDDDLSDRLHKLIVDQADSDNLKPR